MKTGKVVSLIGVLVVLGCTTTPPRVVEAPGLKISFRIDRDVDVRGVLNFFRHDDPAGLESRAMSMGVDVQLARMIRDANPSEARDLAARLVDERFKSSGAAIEASVVDFEALWKDLLPLYSQVAMETTESPWVQPEYTCVVSSIHPGLSSWRGNMVGIRFDSAPEIKRRILAHEILLSDVFQLLRKRYGVSEISDWQVWAFSEITAVLVLDDSRLRPYWTNMPHAGDYFAHANYPQLSKPEKLLKDLFDRRANYADYEQKAVAVLKDFQPFQRRSSLGVFFHDVQFLDPSERLAEQLQLPTTKGALILGIYKGSAADAAGLMVGDFVTAVGSALVESSGDFVNAVGSLTPGTTTNITVVRLGEQKTLSVTIGESDVRDRDPVVQPKNLWPGFTASSITKELRETTGIPEDTQGVVVVSITDQKSPAAIAGLRMNDIITATNGTRVETTMDFYRALNATGGRSAALEIYRGGTRITLAL